MAAASRALVTGADGFTGRYMVQALAQQGYEVHGLVRHAPQTPLEHTADLTDPAAVARVVRTVLPNVVVHLAGVAFVAHQNVDDIYRVNFLGSLYLLQALAQLPTAPDCVLLASSGNVYGNQQGGKLSESTPPRPANHYAASKLAMEHMALQWLPQLPIVIARPFNYTGVGQSEQFVLPKIVAHIRRRAPSIRLGNLDVWRDFGDVRSVTQAYTGLLQVRPIGQIVNVCTGTPRSLREVIAILEQQSGHHLALETDPQLIRANEVTSLCGDPSTLQRLLPKWKPLSLEETLEWMLAAA